MKICLLYLYGFVQILDFMLNVTQVSNDELLEHLIRQDSMLDNQTENYLKKIIKNQSKIINQNEEILRKIKGEP